MSEGTNQERLQQNNEILAINNTKIQEVIQKANELPEYQDVQPIYATLEYIAKTYDISEIIDNLKATPHWEELNFIPVENNSKFLLYYRSGSRDTYTYYLHICKLVDDNKIVFENNDVYAKWTNATVNGFSFGGFKDNKWVLKHNNNNSIRLYDFNDRTSSFTDFTQLSTSYETTFYMIENGIFINRYGLYIVDFDNKSCNYISGGDIISPVPYGNGYFGDSYGSNRPMYHWDLETYSVAQLDIVYGDNVQGINFYGNKIIMNNNLYHFDNGVVGDLIKTNVDSYYPTYIKLPLNDKYYSANGKLLMFDEDTNTFNNTGSNYNKASADYTLKKLYNTEFNVSDEPIGIYYEGKPFYIKTQPSKGSSTDILAGKSYFNGAYEKIVGTMPNNGELNYTPSTEEQIIPAGYTSGGTIAASSMTQEEYDEALNIANQILGKEI